MGKSKEIQAAKAAAKGGKKDDKGGSGGKAKKKKWSKGRVKEKLSNKVLFDKKAHGTLLKDVPKMKDAITVYKVSNHCTVTGSAAVQGIRHLESKGLIKPVVNHSRMKIYVSAQRE